MESCQKCVLAKATAPSNNNINISGTITFKFKSSILRSHFNRHNPIIIIIISKIAIATTTPSPSCCYWRHHHPTTTSGQVFSTTLRLFGSLNAFNFCSGCAVCTIAVVLEPPEEIFWHFDCAALIFISLPLCSFLQQSVTGGIQTPTDMFCLQLISNI